MPTPPDMTHLTDEHAEPEPLADVTAEPTESDDFVAEQAERLLSLQHQVAIFARRAEQTRLGGIGPLRNSMDRAAYLLLNRLHREGPMGVKALAAGMRIDSSTVTRQVAPLVEAGLVYRATDPEDGRAVVLRLSDKGIERLEEVRSSRRDLMGILTREWSEEELTTFCALLTRFNKALLDVRPTTEADTTTP